jgi:hypothetical protein
MREFKIISGSFLTLGQGGAGPVDDSVGGISRSRVVSDRLPDWDPLPPTSDVVKRKRKGKSKKKSA